VTAVENLLPIGRFSKMTRLSVKALRHYDELGLLVPAVVDPISGYRYYTYSQANRAEAVRILRGLDMPLDQIRELLESDDGEVTRRHLEVHRASLQERRERHDRMLSFIERLIERKEGVMPYEVGVKEVAAQRVAIVRRRTSMSAIGKDIAEAFTELGEAVHRAAVPVTGPPFMVMHDVIDEETDGEIELAFPVATPFESVGDVRCEELPAATVAWTLHHGPYDEVGPAYHTVTGWIQEHGHEVAGPPREVYLSDPGETPDPADYLTEVQFPIR
jgi:effector-binding domain-containing protein